MDNELRLLAKTHGFTGMVDGEINRMQITTSRHHNSLNLSFLVKPTRNIRQELRFNGFKWKRKSKFWESFLNERQCKRVKQIYRSINKNKGCRYE